MDLKLIYLAVIVLVANTVEAISGFGSTIISVTLGSNFYPISVLLPVLVPLNLLLSFYIVFRYSKHIDKDFLIKKILPFMCSGFIIGLVIFSFLQGDILKRIYGALIIALSIRELIKLIKNKSGEILSSSKAIFWLILSGIIHGIYASGGPLLVYAMSSKKFSKESFRSNLSVIWLVLNFFLVVFYLYSSRINYQTLKLSLYLFPMLPIGIFLGELLHHKIDETKFRVVIFSLLLMAGVSLIL